jgi:outer membrane protein TolC
MSAAAMTLLAGRAVGPDFERPAAPSVERYTPGKLPTQTASAPGPGGAAQRLVAGRDIPGEWWALFHSSPLNALIAEALHASPNLASAEAALRQGHELTLAGEGAFFRPCRKMSAPAATRRRPPCRLRPPAAASTTASTMRS